jgi:hypothetical protein
LPPPAQSTCRISPVHVRLEDEQACRFREERMARNVVRYQRLRGRRLEVMLVGLRHAANLGNCLSRLGVASELIVNEVFPHEAERLNDALQYWQQVRLQALESPETRFSGEPNWDLQNGGQFMQGNWEDLTRCFLSGIGINDFSIGGTSQCIC